jgi:PAS domain S-box-containing protein
MNVRPTSYDSNRRTSSWIGSSLITGALFAFGAAIIEWILASGALGIGGASPVEAAAGIALAAALPAAWPSIVGAWLGLTAAAWLGGEGTIAAAVAPAILAGSGVAVAWMLRRLGLRSDRLGFVDLALLLGIGATAVSTVAAATATFDVWLSSGALHWPTSLRAFAAHLLGAAMVTPLVALGLGDRSRTAMASAGLGVLATLAVVALAATADAATHVDPLAVQALSVAVIVASLGFGVALRERSEALDDAQRSDARLRSFAEAASSWLWEQDVDGRVTYLSPSFERIAHIPRDGILGRRLSDWGMVDVDVDGSRLAKFEADIAARRDVASMRFRWRGTDGRTRTFAMAGTAIFDPDGRFAGFRGIGQDVTAEVEAAAAAGEFRQRFLQTIESPNDGIAFWDRDDRLVICNQEYRRLSGAAGRVLVSGVSYEHYLRESVRLAEIDQAIGDEEAWIAQRLARHRKQTEPIELKRRGRWLLVREQATADAGLLIVATDITSLKLREDELRQAKSEAESSSRAKSEFLARMSHELRTPLNAIMGFAEIIRDRMFGPTAMDRYVGYANDIHNSAKHLLELIADILDMSRIEAGQYRHKEEETDLNLVVASCVSMMAKTAADARIVLINAMPETMPRIVADPRALKQVFLNLISNGIKFTPAGGVVTVTGRWEEDRSVVATVTDTGVGMAEQELVRIFEPFRQSDASRRGAVGGTGLGLAISKSIVDLHGGTIAIESTPGKGTRVTLVLPASRVVPTAAP